MALEFFDNLIAVVEVDELLLDVLNLGQNFGVVARLLRFLQ